jgi:hypothetical protein
MLLSKVFFDRYIVERMDISTEFLVLCVLQYVSMYLLEVQWVKNTHPETIEEEPLIIELEVEDLMVVWPDGLVYPVTIAVRSHIVELNNETMKNV